MPLSKALSRRPAFVATTGGHLVQLDLLAAVLEPVRHRDAVWITHDSAQSRSLLAGRDVVFVPMVEARQVHQVVARTPPVLRALRSRGVDTVWSTGAALALSALPLAGLVGARAVFVESLARPDAPSQAGRVVARLPWVECWTQYPHNAGGAWSYRASLLDGYVTQEGPPVGRPLRVVVSLGTARPWGFRRLLERLVSVVPSDAEVLWQTGATDVSGLGIDVRPYLPSDDLAREMSTADVVVTHAGVGSLLTALRAGRSPLLVPRRLAHSEHVDDHQVQIATVADGRGLALYREVDDLTSDDLEVLARRSVVSSAATAGA